MLALYGLITQILGRVGFVEPRILSAHEQEMHNKSLIFVMIGGFILNIVFVLGVEFFWNFDIAWYVTMFYIAVLSVFDIAMWASGVDWDNPE